ncbi:magnesium transporter CorA family protein [Candidatus Parcubacteria bacterium]|nr:magnesium transporter CorA family protein [Patescibacteria group bacterium]MBU4309753.1 magnesium transporter CorA family protein [Patescibacteria group bacterium]MBU4431759.1 magnesium transporter CorA family protein [Patescibacteria group bacterium]MBU4578092.1 magnesium transporter CorA family protein [Patescibacteria group bacterium]MCG2696630.1 magnesium transporter CorA family protein [Candidatus Parcubacteria bacterium]
MSNYQKISKNIHEVTIDNPNTVGGELTWLNITDPGKAEIQFLRQSKKHNFSLAHLQASSTKATAQRPLVEKGSDYLFLILHFPVMRNGSIFSTEIEFFIGKDYVVTLHENIKVLNDFFSICKKDGERLLSTKHESTAVLLYEILERLMVDTYQVLDKMNISINNVEKLIFEQETKKAVSDILFLRRNIISTRRIMQSHKNIIKKLTQPETDLVEDAEVRKYYFTLLELSKRIWESLENQKEMIEVLNSTNESLMNYNMNDIMKTLTIISVIVFPLTLFAAIFSMKVENGMPFLTTPYGFWFIIGLMVIGGLSMLLFFKKKKWL